MWQNIVDCVRRFVIPHKHVFYKLGCPAQHQVRESSKWGFLGMALRLSWRIDGLGGAFSAHFRDSKVGRKWSIWCQPIASTLMWLWLGTWTKPDSCLTLGDGLQGIAEILSSSSTLSRTQRKTVGVCPQAAIQEICWTELLEKLSEVMCGWWAVFCCFAALSDKTKF